MLCGWNEKCVERIYNLTFTGECLINRMAIVDLVFLGPWTFLFSFSLFLFLPSFFPFFLSFHSISPPSICTLWLKSTSMASILRPTSETLYWTCLEMCSLWFPGWLQLDITEVSPWRAPFKDRVSQEVLGSMLPTEDPSLDSFAVRISLVCSQWMNTVVIFVAREHRLLIVSVLFFLHFSLWSWLSFQNILAVSSFALGSVLYPVSLAASRINTLPLFFADQCDEFPVRATTCCSLLPAETRPTWTPRQVWE